MSDSDSSPLSDSAAVALTGKIMVISIIVIFIVVVFVVLLVYSKWFWWRIEEEEDSTDLQQRRRRGRRFVFAPGQELRTAAAQRGLDPTVLKYLPVRVFQAKDFEEGLECAVCLCELEEGEKARLLPKCNHAFHVECIDMWFQSHATCPICRDPVAKDPADSSAAASVEIDNGSFHSVEENLDGAESLNFPTNVLFWGDENQVNSRNASSVEEEGAASSSSSSSSSLAASSLMANRRTDSMLVIDIPREVMEDFPCSSPSPGSRSVEELKSPMAARLRSLKRLLSRKASPSSQSTCGDIEQARKGQSS